MNMTQKATPDILAITRQMTVTAPCEDINPNWPEIDGTWRIEEGKLIRTIISGNQEKQYIVKSLDRDGYYLLCFEGATGEVIAARMIVLYDENNMPLYDFKRKLDYRKINKSLLWSLF